MSHSRIPLLPLEEAKRLARQLEVPEGIAELNVFRVLLHHPMLAKRVNDLLMTLLFRVSRRALSSVNESLEHVFTLLAIAHERELMASALAGLSSGEGHLRGTALELLKSVLPAPVRRRLWPRLDASPAPRERTRTSEQITDELLETTSGQVVDPDSL